MKNEAYCKVMKALDNAPIDDEPLTLRESEGIRESRESYMRGEATLTSEDIRRQLEQ